MMHEGDYEVGYRKPPKEHRFKKGNQIARRRRGKPRQSLEQMLNKKLNQMVSVMRNGRSERIPLIEALLERLVKLATSGSARDLITILNYVDSKLPQAIASPPDSELNLKITYVMPDPDETTPPGCLPPPPEHLLPPEMRRNRDQQDR